MHFIWVISRNVVFVEQNRVRQKITLYRRKVGFRAFVDPKITPMRDLAPHRYFKA